jgi:hypothetical protein
MGVMGGSWCGSTPCGGFLLFEVYKRGEERWIWTYILIARLTIPDRQIANTPFHLISFVDRHLEFLAQHSVEDGHSFDWIGYFVFCI